MQIEIKIEDITREQIIEAAATYVLSEGSATVGDHDGEGRYYRREYEASLRARIERQIEESVTDTVSKMVDDAVRARIAAEVERVLVDGWAITDDHGRETGKRRTLSSIVLDALSVKQGYNNASLAMHVSTETITRMLQSAFGAEVTAAQKAFRTQVDELLNAKIADALRTALGLR